MTSNREFAAVIWIAITMIAVQLLPATALAHDGHAHVRVSITADGAAGDAIQFNAAKTTGEHTGAFAQAESAEDSRASTSGTCNSGCCASGFSCCVPAILAEPTLRLPNRLKALKVERPGTSIRAGIDPEALPEPPKSFT
jgi:hypothetical protein